MGDLRVSSNWTIHVEHGAVMWETGLPNQVGNPQFSCSRGVIFRSSPRQYLMASLFLFIQFVIVGEILKFVKETEEGCFIPLDCLVQWSLSGADIISKRCTCLYKVEYIASVTFFLPQHRSCGFFHGSTSIVVGPNITFNVSFGLSPSPACP